MTNHPPVGDRERPPPPPKSGGGSKLQTRVRRRLRWGTRPEPIADTLGGRTLRALRDGPNAERMSAAVEATPVQLGAATCPTRLRRRPTAQVTTQRRRRQPERGHRCGGEQANGLQQSGPSGHETPPLLSVAVLVSYQTASSLRPGGYLCPYPEVPLMGVEEEHPGRQNRTYGYFPIGGTGTS